MHFQLTHEAERRWALVLVQIEENRLECMGAGSVQRLKGGDLYNQAGVLQATPAAKLLATA